MRNWQHAPKISLPFLCYQGVNSRYPQAVDGGLDAALHPMYMQKYLNMRYVCWCKDEERPAIAWLEFAKGFVLLADMSPHNNNSPRAQICCYARHPQLYISCLRFSNLNQFINEAAEVNNSYWGLDVGPVHVVGLNSYVSFWISIQNRASFPSFFFNTARKCSGWICWASPSATFCSGSCHSHRSICPFIGSQVPYGNDSVQAKWFADHMKKVNAYRKATPWVIVIWHTAAYHTYNKHFRVRVWLACCSANYKILRLVLCLPWDPDFIDVCERNQRGWYNFLSRHYDVSIVSLVFPRRTTRFLRRLTLSWKRLALIW